MEPVETTEEPASGPPKWLVPLMAGAIALLLVVLAFMVFRDDGSSEIASVTAPTTAPTTVAPTTAPTTVPATTAAPTTVAPTTAPPTTAPATTVAPTTAPATTSVATTTPAGPLAADVSTLAPGEVSIATADGVVTLREVASCRVTAAVGFNVYSYLLDGDPQNSPVVLEIGVEEGAAPFVVLNQLRGELEGFNGQDNSAGNYWSGALPGGINDATNQLTLTPLGGFAEGEANVSFDFDSDTEGCATGVLIEPWPFTVDQNPRVVDPFDASVVGSHQFSVLGTCDADGSTLILSEAGLLSSFELDGELFATIQLFSQTDDPLYLSRFEPGQNETIVDQQGGGGDIIYVARVSAFDGSNARYLSWTQPPTNVTGGLPVVSC